MVFRVFEEAKRAEDREQIINERNRGDDQDQILNDRENLRTLVRRTQSFPCNGTVGSYALVAARPAGRNHSASGKGKCGKSMLPPREILA
jgi:hypothetical protein